jgi:hypothetical protein
MITWINNVVYRIQHHPKLKMILVHLDRLAPTSRCYSEWDGFWRKRCNADWVEAGCWITCQYVYASQRLQTCPSSCIFQKLSVPCLSHLHQTVLQI